MNRCRVVINLLCAGLICGALLGSGCGTAHQRAVLASGARVLLPPTSQTLRLRPLELTVQVLDASGAPVDDVPVQFRIAEPYAALAAMDPPRVVTRDGHATSTFRSRSEGRIGVEITVEEHTEVVYITVVEGTPRF